MGRYTKVQQPPVSQNDASMMMDDFADYPTYPDKEQDQLRFQLDVKPILNDFEKRVLRGQYESINEKSGAVVWLPFDEDAQPIINEIGIREIMGRLLGYCNIATKLSWYSVDEIYKSLFYFDMSLTELIAKRADYWELDIETAKLIKDSCVELVQTILFSARNGFTAINLKTQYSRQDVSRSEGGMGESQKTFLGIPLGKK